MNLITSRRNFLARAVGLTAGGVVLSVPIVTLANARERMDYHRRELEKAFREYHAGVTVAVSDNGIAPNKIADGSIAAMTFIAHK